MGVRGVIFDFQEWLVRLKCILEAFGTGVPARKVTVKLILIISASENFGKTGLKRSKILTLHVEYFEFGKF